MKKELERFERKCAQRNKLCTLYKTQASSGKIHFCLYYELTPAKHGKRINTLCQRQLKTYSPLLKEEDPLNTGENICKDCLAHCSGYFDPLIRREALQNRYQKLVQALAKKDKQTIQTILRF